MSSSPEKCPSCGWLQTPSRERVCTSCHKRLDPPHAFVEPAARREIDSTLAPKIAGGALIVNASLAVASWVVLPGELEASSIRVHVAPLAIDVTLGVLLLAGRTKYRGWVIARIVLAALYYAFVGRMASHPWNEIAPGLAVLGVFAASLIALLIGTPGKVRVSVATLGLALVFVVAGVGLMRSSAAAPAPAATPENPLVAASEPILDGTVRGVRFPWKLAAPSPAWRRFKLEVVREHNALADAWLVEPSLDAHFIVLPRVVPEGERPDLDRIAETVLGDLGGIAPDATIADQGLLRLSRFEEGRTFHVRATLSGRAVDYEIALIRIGRHVFQVQAWCPREAFERLAPDFMRAIESFDVETR